MGERMGRRERGREGGKRIRIGEGRKVMEGETTEGEIKNKESQQLGKIDPVFHN